MQPNIDMIAQDKIHPETKQAQRNFLGKPTQKSGGSSQPADPPREPSSVNKDLRPECKPRLVVSVAAASGTWHRAPSEVMPPCPGQGEGLVLPSKGRVPGAWRLCGCSRPIHAGPTPPTVLATCPPGLRVLLKSGRADARLHSPGLPSPPQH